MNIKPILLRILGWAVFFSFFLLIFPPFKRGKSGGTNGEKHPMSETYVDSFPEKQVVKNKPVSEREKNQRNRFEAKPQIKPAPRAFVKVPPKAIVVPEDPVPSAVAKKKTRQVSRRIVSSKKSTPHSTRQKQTSEQLKVKITPVKRKASIRYYRLKKQFHGKLVRLRRWASPRAFWGAEIHDYEDLILSAQRWHHGTGTLWIKVTRKNGRSGWLPYGYIN
ncbi:MAG: hypothetical protein KJO21_03915 [Verrucomicrobiae bacterium]|nr:hypothetical protein [Verrucomicrobiae bacterium]NNJ42645.1 hypothetical protein [Akkermansiaceae bacterium]